VPTEGPTTVVSCTVGPSLVTVGGIDGVITGHAALMPRVFGQIWYGSLMIRSLVAVRSIRVDSAHTFCAREVSPGVRGGYLCAMQRATSLSNPRTDPISVESGCRRMLLLTGVQVWTDDPAVPCYLTKRFCSGFQTFPYDGVMSGRLPDSFTIVAGPVSVGYCGLDLRDMLTRCHSTMCRPVPKSLDGTTSEPGMILFEDNPDRLRQTLLSYTVSSPFFVLGTPQYRDSVFRSMCLLSRSDADEYCRLRQIPVPVSGDTYPIQTNAVLLTLGELVSMMKGGTISEVLPTADGLEARAVTSITFSQRPVRPKTRLGQMSAMTHLKFMSGSVITNHTMFLFNLSNVIPRSADRRIAKYVDMKTAVLRELDSPLLSGMVRGVFPETRAQDLISPDLFYHSYTGPTCGIIFPEGPVMFAHFNEVCGALGWTPRCFSIDACGGLHALAWAEGCFHQTGHDGLHIQRIIVSPAFSRMPGLPSSPIRVLVEHGGQCIPLSDYNQRVTLPWASALAVTPRVVLSVPMAREDIVRSSLVN
jgi:hypothetical protein